MTRILLPVLLLLGLTGCVAYDAHYGRGYGYRPGGYYRPPPGPVYQGGGWYGGYGSGYNRGGYGYRGW